MDRKYPDWNDKEGMEEALKKIKERATIHKDVIEDTDITVSGTGIEEVALVENPPVGNTLDLHNIITYVKKFAECRSCGKTAGYVVLPQLADELDEDLDFDFECMACYEDEMNG